MISGVASNTFAYIANDAIVRSKTPEKSDIKLQTEPAENKEQIKQTQEDDTKAIGSRIDIFV